MEERGINPPDLPLWDVESSGLLLSMRKIMLWWNLVRDESRSFERPRLQVSMGNRKKKCGHPASKKKIKFSCVHIFKKAQKDMQPAPTLGFWRILARHTHSPYLRLCRILSPFGDHSSSEGFSSWPFPGQFIPSFALSFTPHRSPTIFLWHITTNCIDHWTKGNQWFHGKWSHNVSAASTTGDSIRMFPDK